MIRIVKLTGEYYGYEDNDLEQFMEDVKQFADEGNAVLVVESLECAEEFGVDPDEVQMIDPD